MLSAQCLMVLAVSGDFVFRSFQRVWVRFSHQVVLNVPTRGTSYRQGPCLCFHKESSTLPEGFMFELGYGKATFSRVERVSIQRDFDSWTGSAVISRAWRLLGDC